MKTHELAKALNHLSRVLRAGPNVDFEELTNFSTYLTAARPQKITREVADKAEVAEKATGLALLAQMANYNKQELLELADLLGIPVDVRKADAVRDILGKILRYIQQNPEVRERLVSKADDTHKADDKEPVKPSSLARALAILLNQS